MFKEMTPFTYVNEAQSMLDKLSETFDELIIERRKAITYVYRIVKMLNNSEFLISLVTFKTPVKVEYISDSGLIETVVTDICDNGDSIVVADDNGEFCIENLTAESLNQLLEAMTLGSWSVCRFDTDEGFTEISYEELCNRTKSERNRRFASKSK